jgi:hypothetical protein
MDDVKSDTVQTPTATKADAEAALAGLQDRTGTPGNALVTMQSYFESRFQRAERRAAALQPEAACTAAPSESAYQVGSVESKMAAEVAASRRRIAQAEAAVALLGGNPAMREMVQAEIFNSSPAGECAGMNRLFKTGLCGETALEAAQMLVDNRRLNRYLVVGYLLSDCNHMVTNVLIEYLCIRINSGLSNDAAFVYRDIGHAILIIWELLVSCQDCSAGQAEHLLRAFSTALVECASTGLVHKTSEGLLEKNIITEIDTAYVLVAFVLSHVWCQCWTEPAPQLEMNSLFGFDGQMWPEAILAQGVCELSCEDIQTIAAFTEQQFHGRQLNHEALSALFEVSVGAPTIPPPQTILYYGTSPDQGGMMYAADPVVGQDQDLELGWCVFGRKDCRLYVLANAPSVQASPPVLIHGILMGTDTEIILATDESFTLESRVFYDNGRSSNGSSDTRMQGGRRSYLFKASSRSQCALWLATFRKFIWEAHKSEANDMDNISVVKQYCKLCLQKEYSEICAGFMKKCTFVGKVLELYLSGPVEEMGADRDLTPKSVVLQAAAHRAIHRDANKTVTIAFDRLQLNSAKLAQAIVTELPMNVYNVVVVQPQPSIDKQIDRLLDVVFTKHTIGSFARVENAPMLPTSQPTFSKHEVSLGAACCARARSTGRFINEDEALFYKHDVDGDGVLESTEFRGLLESVDRSRAMNEESYHRFASEEGLTKTELTLAKFCSYSNYMRRRNWAMQCYDYYNTAQDGALDIDELSTLFTAEYIACEGLEGMFPPWDASGWARFTKALGYGQKFSRPDEVELTHEQFQDFHGRVQQCAILCNWQKTLIGKVKSEPSIGWKVQHNRIFEAQLKRAGFLTHDGTRQYTTGHDGVTRSTSRHIKDNPRQISTPPRASPVNTASPTCDDYGVAEGGLQKASPASSVSSPASSVNFTTR